MDQSVIEYASFDIAVRAPAVVYLNGRNSSSELHLHHLGPKNTEFVGLLKNELKPYEFIYVHTGRQTINVVIDVEKMEIVKSPSRHLLNQKVTLVAKPVFVNLYIGFNCRQSQALLLDNDIQQINDSITVLYNNEPDNVLYCLSHHLPELDDVTNTHYVVTSSALELIKYIGKHNIIVPTFDENGLVSLSFIMVCNSDTIETIKISDLSVKYNHHVR